jgi:hypothetical protein
LEKKWYATIRANDLKNGFKIKIGIKKNGCFEIINNDKESQGNKYYANTHGGAIDTISKLWGTWETFDWIE